MHFKYFVLTAIFCLLNKVGLTQDCNCLESFNWMVNTFEKNDAGFQYIIDKKGKNDYEKHNLIFKDKVVNVTKVSECGPLLYEWLHYFRPGHISIQLKEQNIPLQNKPDEEIRKQFRNEKVFDFSEKQMLAYLNEKKNKNPIEGIWSNGGYKIGIIANEKENGKFIGFIIKADNVYWMQKQIKVEIISTGSEYLTEYYMRDHSKEKGKAQVIGESKSILLLNNSYWLRDYPKYSYSKYEDIFASTFKEKQPFIKKISDKTLYLRIPSFLHEQKVLIDSVLAKNHNLIINTPNLIIDIRNGTGGGDDSYSGLMKYLYTNPRRNVGVQLYSTELNAQAYENYAKEYTDSADVRYFKSVSSKMRLNLGKFIDMDDNPYSTDSSGTVLPLPAKVAIICNENNGSTDEQFLLEAKQSKKVKIFGHSTGGMLDISNMNHIDFPNGKFTLGYCMSKSYRIPKFCIDGIGIQPDFFIDDGIPLFEWVEFVQQTIEK